MNKIQVGFLVSYDYELLKKAIPPVYEAADTIYLAIDKNRKTWKGETFTIDSSFFDWISSIDIHNKIILFEDDFYVKNLTSMECEVRERIKLSEKMGLGNWLIQLDADEYFLDFKGFTDFLKSKNELLQNPEKTPVQISPFLINIFKKTPNGILYVDAATKIMAATNFPAYKVGRKTKKRIIYVPFIILHETLSRTREELDQKLRNWGHDKDIDKDAFLNKWESVNEENYKTMQDFFYLEPEKWKSLNFVKGHTVEAINANLDYERLIPSKSYLWKKNVGQWFKYLFK